MFLKGVLSEEKTDKLVKKELMNQGFTRSLKIKKIIYADGNIIYHIYDYLKYKGKTTKVLTVINCKDYMKLLRRALLNKKIMVSELRPNIKKKELTYHMSYQINKEKSDING